MAQLFGPDADRKLRRTVLLAVLVVVALIGFGYFRVRSNDYWHVGKPAPQPIAFNHALHVKGLGMECRFCHTGAAEERGAGMPSARTCLTCHSQIWRGVPELEPLRTSVALEEPIRWQSVVAFPDFARFHHGSHIAAGIECSTCHGDVAAMTETVAAKPLSMDFCVSCHQDPPAPPPMTLIADRLPPASHRERRDLTDCSVCHY